MVKTKTVVLGAAGLVAAMMAARAIAPRRRTSAVPGRRTPAAKLALGLGARLLQRKAPLRAFDHYVIGFHPMKDDPNRQVIAYHYCQTINDDFTQCILFDGDDRHARMTGVEFIISERLFESLPQEEQQLWHPHNYEILSGTLIAPGIPERVERELMRRLLNTYGKTWHFWTAGQAGHPDGELPLGAPCLAWSFNHDNEADERLISMRDARARVSTEQRRQRRAALAAYARPQRGVELLRDRFPGQHPAPPGIEARGGHEPP